MTGSKARWKRLLAYMLAFAMVFSSAAVSSFGTATVQAASKSIKSVKVQLKVGSKDVTKKTITLGKGCKVNVDAIVRPKSAKKSPVKFASAKKSVATVNKNGIITGKKVGTAKINVTATGKDNKKVTTYVKVKVVNVSLKLNKKNASLNVGKTTTLKATVTPKDSKVTWSTSNKSVATVTKKGVVKGVKAGTATITAKAGTKKATCKVTVKAATSSVAVTSVEASADPTEISVGGITQVVASVLPANATDKKITYKSSNPSIASVDSETGVVTGISGGTATITASSSNGKSKSIDITVTYVPVTKITVDPSAVVIGVTGTYELKANIIPENASAKLPIWSSSDETVATVDSSSGKVTGVAEGTATITASVEGSEVVGQCVVTVGKADGVTMKLANPYAYEVNGKSIGETVLYGKDMDIVVHVNRDGQPAKNTNVTLKMIENNIDGVESNINSSHYEIKGDGYNTTDQYGDIHFAVALKKDFADKNAINGGESETYTLTAMDVSTGNKAEIKVNTAVFDIGGITVSDNGGVKAGKNWQSENASTSAEIKTKSLDATTDNQVYLASQEVSLSGKEDHNVEFVVNPKIRFGLDEKATRAEWSREYTDNNPAKPGAGASDTYSIYNAADNTTTTTQIERVPAGMAYLTVNFSKIDISKYTKIHVGLTQKGQPVTDKVTLTNENNTGSNSNIRSVQIDASKANKDEETLLVISIVTQGRKSVNETGYVLESVVGRYRTGSKVNYKEEILSNVVKWEDVTSKVTYQSKVRPASDYTNYITADAGTDLKYRVPVFPYTGDAFITCTKGGKTVTYAYPVQSKNNENDLYPAGKYKAMEVTDDEATKLVTGSDLLGWTEKGNNLIVNSSVTGMTALKATIDIDGIDEDELNAHNGKELYTSVQWSPVTASSESAAVYPDYYAVEGQTVTVIAQLTDKNNNKATVGNQTIDFTYGEGASKQSIQAGKPITLANGKKIYVQSNTFNTDSNGQARLVLLGEGLAVLNNLRAIAPAGTDYNVNLTIDSDAVKDTINDGADFYWVDLGLSYQEEDDTNSIKDSVSENVTKEIEDHGKSKITESWEVGYQATASAAARVGRIAPIVVSNVPVKYEVSSPETKYWDGKAVKTFTISSGNASDYLQVKNNGKIDYAVVTSNRTVSMNLTGSIDADKVNTANNITFTTVDTKDGKNVSTGHPNIGRGVSRLIDTTKLVYIIDWEGLGNEEAALTVSRNCTTGQSVTVKVRLKDSYGNLYDCSMLSCKYYDASGTENTATPSNSKPDEGYVEFTTGAVNVEGPCRINIVDNNNNVIATESVWYTEAVATDMIASQSADSETGLDQSVNEIVIE